MEPASNNTQVNIAMEELKTKLYAWYNHIFATEKKAGEGLVAGSQNVEKQAESHKEISQDNNTDDASFRKFLSGKKSSHLSSATKSAKIDLYLNESTIDCDDQKFDLLGWWKVNSLCFPIIAILAQKILITPMTSIALESAFSTGGRILSDSRTQLTPTTLEALVCRQDWIYHDEGLNEFETAISNQSE
jgi:hypothetical protein